MPDDPRVQQLLDELLDADGTPEDVCRSCPDLLPVVRDRWRQMNRARAELDAVFPLAGERGTGPWADPSGEPPLPAVPGYEVERVLGVGGMGVVFRARHLRLDRVVALKMILAGAYAGRHERDRFQREAEAVARLQHPNVVQIHDVGEADGRPYFTMEYLGGGSLAQKLSGTPQPAREAAALVATIAGAVHVAHGAGVVHRDLKPANVLLTADGTPKVGDFGLARRLDGDAGLTGTGTAVGTPSYMAPEQAEGNSRAVGPAADTYALGAILYELLTGRPPFRAETAAETLRQAVARDPVPPSRLNAAVPRDAETICLKCLAKDPQRRYASAAALAEDLHRFERNEPIAARRMGHGERLLRWVRRKPTAAALLSTALALVGLALGGGTWLVQQRAERRAELRSEVGTAVAQAESLRKRFHFREARGLLERAGQRLGPTGHDELRRQVTQALDDLELVERLDVGGMRAATLVEGKFDVAAAEPHYLETFAKAGLGGPGDDPDAVAARVRASAVCAELVAALDDWACITPNGARMEWLLAVARAADPDPARNRLRRPDLWQDGRDLARIVQKLGVDEQSPQLAMAVARVLRRDGGDPIPLLSAAQARFPQDFWLNFLLGWLLRDAGRSDEAIGFLRAAEALRPEASPVHVALGLSLLVTGRRDEATRHFEQAVHLDPTYALAHGSLGIALWQGGRLDKAIPHLREAVRGDAETSAPLRCHLGEALLKEGHLDEAIRHLREAVRGGPAVSARAHTLLGDALRFEGRADEAIGHYREAVRSDPKAPAGTYYRLANALRDKRRPEEAVDHLQQAVQLDPEYTQAWVALDLAWCEAARAAVAAAAGPKQVGEAQRQALAWLRASLKLRTKLLSEGKGAGWDIAAWQTDPALAGVRDGPALARMPDAERVQWQRFWADVSAAAAAGPAADGPRFAASGDWARAADRYAQALKRGPTDNGHFWFEFAAVSLLSGDRPGYARACAFLTDKGGKKDGPRPYLVARTCTLAPDAVAELSLPARLAEKELKDRAKEFWSLTERGALAYRAGHYQDAVPFFEQSLAADAKPGRAVVNWLWLALAQHRLGKAEEARRWLAKARAWLDQCHDGMPARADEDLGLHLHNWLEARVLLREAVALIHPAEKR